jgi:hypothetical protein
MRDLYSQTMRTLSVGAIVAAADKVGAIIDHVGRRAAVYEIDIGIGGITFDGTNKIEFFLEHGDDAALADATKVADADVLGVTGVTNGILKSLITAHAAASVHRFGYRGSKRYTRMTADFSGTHGTGTPISITCLLAKSYLTPEAAQP